ncbi:MAG: pyruvate, phosphate dikinase [Sedimentisphaerales bacterium]|jgi:pyruvate,orthophosphate dikinase|nr:pyruvate, phosphate dikinase [Sedimentisphaerales bacterium]NLZ03904.1 pyruvate, phosphate dikinase [Phycisphaerae bacterium]HNY80451.1 pyruvate, phosphate dikinase [Sedimentisphaerales bacterium]HOC65292.1 pyruvate, phosphate dikinase [Sedimentisphaerales bacterium]HOH66216.1 pyruvate, phosphate dikinase [Sedimentisphaerales bacterium]
MAEKRVYFFGNGKAEGNAKMKELLGGKGANLAEMTNLGVPVPPGFTIATKVCGEYYKSKGKWPKGLDKEVDANLAKLEKAMGMKMSDPDRPLLVSVRSGAAASMPGMMDTVLNLGLNDRVVEGIIKKTGNARFAYDIYRRFIDMFGDVVMGCHHDYFEEKIHEAKKRAGVELDSDLNAEQLHGVVEAYKKVYKDHVGEMFPQDGKVQLTHAINAVFGSWNSPRAIRYRELNHIKGLLGTAVNVQAMVFGNMGDDCGTGVCFTRNPSTGQKEFYGEFLMNAQGEDVVAGIRTPIELSKLNKVMPKAYTELTRLMTRLEKHYKDMQDMEFTIQEKKLYILQTRTGKRTAPAAVKIAVDMVNERLIPKKDAVMRVTPDQLDQLLHPQFDPKAKRDVIGKGLPASPGAAVGQIVFTAEVAEAWREDGKKVILVRRETSPEDIGGMDAAQGILTAFGGMTSHAAVVARGMGKCCVAGVSNLDIDYASKKLNIGKVALKEGDWISLDGSSGEVMNGQLATVSASLSGDFGKFMKMCDQVRTLGVRTNADTPADAQRARDFGAEGIGLTRTEHMFFEGDRIWPVRQMILAADDYAAYLKKLAAAEDDTARKAIEKENAQIKDQFEGALKKLLPLQRGDFEGIFTAMAGLPVTVRLLDPPLHEFLPQDKENQAEMASRLGVDVSVVKTKVELLHEFNPMLGHRGCRLTITYPAIARMQARAIIEAALNVKKKGKKVLPEIMIPLVGHVSELKLVKDDIVDEINTVFKERKAKIEYMVGTMIEVPRAAVTADEIAQEAQFFSFGTNDLTQMTMGFSRDDAGRFLGEYVAKGIYAADPFQKLDQVGVGKLVEMGTKLGRKTRKKLKVGICGEHGGEPSSIDFCHRVGMNYVSCSPFRVPIARLAAAQAAVRNK